MKKPMIKATEWKLIEPLLPPSDGPGKPRRDDRRYLSAFFYAAACNCSLEGLPPAYGNPRNLRTRKQRWEADGTLARLMKIGAPVIARMRAGYWGLIRDASNTDSLNWRTSSEFFSKGVIPRLAGMQPRGRYAGRQRP